MHIGVPVSAISQAYSLVSKDFAKLRYIVELLTPGLVFAADGKAFGPAIEVYYLIAVWCLVCMVAMFAFSQTPLGRISNAVRDNPERAEFVGYDTQRVRFLVLIVSAFFAGISGGLAAINFEIVTAENVSAARSGGVLLANICPRGARR